MLSLLLAWRNCSTNSWFGDDLKHLNTYSMPLTVTEMLSFWWNFHHWLHRKLSKWQLPVQPVMKISSKWQHFHFSIKMNFHISGNISQKLHPMTWFPMFHYIYLSTWPRQKVGGQDAWVFDVWEIVFIPEWSPFEVPLNLAQLISIVLKVSPVALL